MKKKQLKIIIHLNFRWCYSNFNQNDEEEEAPTEEIKTKRSEIRQQLLAGK